MNVSHRASRQSFLGEKSERIIRDAKVAIIGLGGGGSHIAQQLAHVGVHHFVLIDDDRIEESNLNRLIGSRPNHAKRQTQKTEVIKDLILGINPKADIFCSATKWEERHELLRDCSVVFGCVDSFLARDQLERYCRRYMLPYIDIGMDVKEVPAGYSISGQVVVSIPGLPCMRCLGFLSDALINAEVQRYGAAGSRPQVVWANAVLASTAVGTFVQMISPWRRQDLELYIEYDGNKPSLNRSRLVDTIGGKTCPHFSKLEDIGDVDL
jgi:hypothetical protein